MQSSHGVCRETYDWGQGIDSPVGRVNLQGACTPPRRHGVSCQGCWLLASTVLKPSREVGEMIGRSSSLETTVRRKGLLMPASGVQNQPPSASPSLVSKRVLHAPSLPAAAPNDCKHTVHPCSSIARQRSLQALLSSPSSLGPALPHALPLRGSEIQVCSRIQSEFGASLGNVGRREEERKCQMSEHRMGSHRYRGESWRKKGPTTGSSELAGMGIS